jgi:hypothetical protein
MGWPRRPAASRGCAAGEHRGPITQSVRGFQLLPEFGDYTARPFIADSLEAGLRDDDELLGMLVILKDVYTDFESARELSPFHLLYYAFDDLVHQEEQWYWDGATRENIRDLIRAEAMRFIEEDRRRSRQ